MLGRAAKKPYFLGLESRSLAAYSLVLRARAALASRSLRMQAPGAVRDKMVVVMPNFLLTASSSSGVQSGMNQPEGSPPDVITASHEGC